MTACPASAVGFDGPPTLGVFDDGVVTVEITHVDWRLDGQFPYGFTFVQLAGPPITGVVVHFDGRSFTYHRTHDVDTFVGEDGTHLPFDGFEFCYEWEQPTTTTVPVTTTSSTVPAPTTVPSTTTTTVATTLPPPTTAAPSTTVVVEPTTVATATTVGVLPRTGGPADTMAAAGGGLLLLGAALVVAAKRWAR